MNILNMKQAQRDVKLISAAGKKLDERIHNVAVSGVAHCLMYGDTTLISDLCRAMPKSGRGNALKQWFTKYLPVEWKAKAHGGKGGFSLKSNHGLRDMHWALKIATTITANGDKFYDKPDTEASVFNPNGSVTSLLNRVKKDHVAFNQSSVDGLKALLALAEKEVSEVA